eukprot:Mrub_04770.p2 GENE.Mrub_04770~~Mrub_04770.p2  ORF type:complete len:194 (+),score=2.33 Mrub_04770:394-975(+)
MKLEQFITTTCTAWLIWPLYPPRITIEVQPEAPRNDVPSYGRHSHQNPNMLSMSDQSKVADPKFMLLVVDVVTYICPSSKSTNCVHIVVYAVPIIPNCIYLTKIMFPIKCITHPTNAITKSIYVILKFYSIEIYTSRIDVSTNAIEVYEMYTHAYDTTSGSCPKSNKIYPAFIIITMIGMHIKILDILALLKY